MSTVGIRELKQNASAVVSSAAAGEVITITDRGRPVAQLSALADTVIDRLTATGQVRRAHRRMRDLPAPTAAGDVSASLAEMRDAERY
ncbi:type II toxin-antitoxin system Phd/YefM family antitoxin [Isoptericola variabilis]|uniref:Antitoxin n=1 Tax=Isoptericola variabilis (strain 225) TaxID=743718 RepID=F6FQ04_ISOV2|nr:type II toxin-antitoxin system prevent-host-death family antitoxin [Isoptericola variabilis]AEG44810.1 prevent-host-death family protein [Isoptericola variabilis 225]